MRERTRTLATFIKESFMRTFIIFLAAAYVTQGQTSLLKHSFESDTEGWMVMGASGSVKVGKEAKSGSGALQFTYSLDNKGISSLIFPAGVGNLTGMRRIRFWVKADHDTPIAVVLAEKKPGGGDYAAVLWAPKNVWQRVDLALSDFVASDGPTDPVDSNGKLDTDQIEGIGIIDFSSVFNQLPAESPMIVEKKVGAHTLLIDDFEILDSANAATAKPGVILIDSFDRGFSEWMTFGGMSLSLSPNDNPVGGPALVASIRGVEGKLALIVRRINPAEIAGAKRLTFEIAAEHEGTFAISIETKKPGATAGQGPRYNFMVNPPEGRKVFRVDVGLADFEHDENSPNDPAGKLEASRIQSIAIGDITALTGAAVADNRIWIGRVEMLK